MQAFKLMAKLSVSNGFGGSIEDLVEVDTIYGYIDLLTGRQATELNHNLQDATHVLLTDNYHISYDNYIIDSSGNTYYIDYIDDPVGLGHHLEVYLKAANRRR